MSKQQPFSTCSSTTPPTSQDYQPMLQLDASSVLFLLQCNEQQHSEQQERLAPNDGHACELNGKLNQPLEMRIPTDQQPPICTTEESVNSNNNNSVDDELIFCKDRQRAVTNQNSLRTNQPEKQRHQLHDETGSIITTTFSKLSDSSTKENANKSQISNSPSEFMPTISCLSCRKLHRKCSKTLPKCSECEIHARECIYKRGKNKQYIRRTKNNTNSECTKIENNEDVSTIHVNRSTTRREEEPKSSLVKRALSTEMPQIQLLESMTRSCVKRQTLTMYFRKMAMGMAVINYEYMEKLFFNDSDTILRDSELQQDEYSLALFYSIQAICDQYSGRREKAWESFNESKKYLGLIFDDVESFCVMSTYNYLAYFLAGEGEDLIAKNYASIVDNYFEKRNRKLLHGQQCFNSNVFNVNNLDKKRGVTRLFFFDHRVSWEPHIKYSHLLSVAFKISTGKEMPSDIVAIVDEDLNEHTYIRQTEVLAKVHLLMKSHHRDLRHAPEYIAIGLFKDTLNVTYLNIESLRVVISKCHNPSTRFPFKQALLKEADVISALTENPIFFGMTASFVFAFAVAAQIHLEMYFDPEILSVTTQEQIANNLLKDYKGLQFLSKYGRIAKKYGHIVSGIEQLLKNSHFSLDIAQKTTFNTCSTQNQMNSNDGNNSSMSSPNSIAYTSNQAIVDSPATKKRRNAPSSQFLAHTAKNFRPGQHSLSKQASKE
ncbi:hypothetical protein C9374_009263 [Naegleria lovaniensis]|uniref:Zn(2)-C6 fungal-type domain-containing protein n=1 Tax=Naegleria lovaniensis TaxID=51637 RepID=A0AA88KEA9_NAELO|nr:uncharacterized protein C9374_009263 [Naegleria lovaniensis]KAG2377352.1 hypothetical protein C9374_009263 [Naegleria lovaniensis]